jgi:hypothetical protein
VGAGVSVAGCLAGGAVAAPVAVGVKSALGVIASSEAAKVSTLLAAVGVSGMGGCTWDGAEVGFSKVGAGWVPHATSVWPRISRRMRR